jgi:prophage regulatory protein
MTGNQGASPPAIMVTPSNTFDADDEFWRINVVMAKTGLSRSTLYAYVANGLFPRQRHLGVRRIAWLASEIRAWIASRP